MRNIVLGIPIKVAYNLELHARYIGINIESL